jgi:hypothetical protein
MYIIRLKTSSLERTIYSRTLLLHSHNLHFPIIYNIFSSPLKFPKFIMYCKPFPTIYTIFTWFLQMWTRGVLLYLDKLRGGKYTMHISFYSADIINITNDNFQYYFSLFYGSDGSSLASHHRGSDLFPDQSMWDLWWIKWQWDKFFWFLWFSRQYHSTMALNTNITSGGWIIGLLLAAVQRHSLAPLTLKHLILLCHNVIKLTIYHQRQSLYNFTLHLLEITLGIPLAKIRNNIKKKMHEILLNIFEASFPTS